MSISIRPLSDSDAEALWRLRLEALVTDPKAFGDSAEEHRETSLEAFISRLGTDQDSFVLGAFDGLTLVGMAGFRRHQNIKERHKGWIWGVFLKPAYRGKGYGSALISQIVDKAGQLSGLTQIHLSVATVQRKARALYERFGFRVFGTERQALFVDGEYVEEDHMVLILD